MLMVVKYIVVCIITAVIPCGHGAPNGSLPKIKSAQCVHQYSIAHRFYVADSASLEVLTCVCHCDNNTAAENYELARETHEPVCNAHIDSLQGFCFNVIQQGVSSRGCSKKGFVYCYNKLTAQNVYNFTALDLISSMYRIVLDQGQIIDVPAKQNVVTIHGSTFKVYTYGDPCVPPGTYLRSYVNIHSTSDTILESCSSSEFGNKFTHTNQFIVTNNFTYHKQLWATIDYSKRVCVGQLSAFNSLDVSEYIDDHKKNCKIITTHLKFNDMSETTAYLYERMDLVLVTTKKRATAKVTYVSVTDYRSLELATFLNGSNNLHVSPVKKSRQSCVCPSCTIFTTTDYYYIELVLTFVVCIIVQIILSNAMLIPGTEYCPRYTTLEKWRKSLEKNLDVESDMVNPDNCDQHSTAKIKHQRPEQISNDVVKLELSCDRMSQISDNELGSKTNHSPQIPFNGLSGTSRNPEDVYLTSADECVSSQGQQSFNVSALKTTAKSLSDTQTKPAMQLTLYQPIPFITYCSSEYEQLTKIINLSDMQVNEQLGFNPEDTQVKQSEENINVHDYDSRNSGIHTCRSTSLYGSNRLKSTNIHKYETIPDTSKKTSV